VRIAKKGTYTAKFTAELGASQPIVAEQKFLVK
jgi:hypothetical protein